MRRVDTLQRHLCNGVKNSGENEKGNVDNNDQVVNLLTPEVVEAKYEKEGYVVPEIAETILTPEQIAQYERDGFVVVKGLINAEDIQMFRDRFAAICSGEVSKGNMLVMRDVVLAKEGASKVKDQKQITKIQDWQEDEVLWKYCSNKDIVKYVEAFCGKNVRSIHTMLINKPPDLGKGTSRHPMHQDLLYFPFRPAKRIVASWTALQKITRDNGCLSVIPGSHKSGLLEHEIPNWEAHNKGYQGVKELTEEDLEKRVFLPMDPGDTVFFHPELIHGSGKNTTSGFRKAISCHYASSDCEFVAIPEHNYGLLREFLGDRMDQFSKKQVIELYTLAWRIKSRYIQGEDPEHWQPMV